MAAVNEHVLLSQPDKLVVLAEVPASDPQPTVTLRLLVEQCSDHYGAGPADADTMEDVACRVPLADLARQGAAERAFTELVARIDNPALRPEVAAVTPAAAARVRASCGAGRGVEFRLRVVFINDASEEAEAEEDDECGSDMEFGEFDLSGARSVRGQQTAAGDDYGHEEDDDDEDGCGAQFTVRPYRGALARGGGGAPSSSLLLSGFEARSDGPELTEEHEVTSYDIQRVVRRALGGGGSVEDDEAYRRALDGGTPVSPASRAAMVGQALQSARQQQQQQQSSKSPRPIFPMRTGF